MPLSTLLNPPPSLSAIATQLVPASASDMFNPIKSFKLTRRSKRSKQETPSVIPLKFPGTRSHASLAPSGTVSSLKTIATAATIHDDRMDVDQDAAGGCDRGKREDSNGGNATGVLDTPRSDATCTIALQRATIASLTEEQAKLKAELADTRRASDEERSNICKMLDTHRAEVQRLEAAAQELDSRYREAIQSQEGLKRELAKSIADGVECKAAILKETHESIEAFSASTEKAQKERDAALKEKWVIMRVAQDRGARLETKLDAVNKLLCVRTEELRIAQHFMSTGDTLSVSDIARAAEILNEDIFQCAMIVADFVIEADRAGALSGGEGDIGCQRLDQARGLIGRHLEDGLVHRLCADVQGGETLLFECLIQNILVKACEEIINHLWHGDSGANKLFEGVWSGVSEEYDPMIARSWRAMAHSQLKRQRLDNSQILESLTTLLDAIGLERSSHVAAKISATLRTKVVDVTKQAQKIKEMMFERVLSVTVEAFLCNTGSSFDDTRMQDPYDHEGQPRGQLVICSTGLGVMCGKHKSSREVVVKSKVLLLSSLDRVSLPELPVLGLDF